MPWWVADYLADTQHLSTVEHGAYCLLIMHYWRHGSVPDDNKQLAAITKLKLSDWLKHRATVATFFLEGWKHKRIETEIAKANAKHEKRQTSGKKGGDASAKVKQNPSNATSNAQASSSYSESEKKDSEANASGADAPRDVRKELFEEGLQILARITGKTPNSCRSTVGLWLKSVDDEAIHVLGAIEEADRNRVADPVAWINRALKPKQSIGSVNGFHRNGSPVGGREGQETFATFAVRAARAAAGNDQPGD